MRQTSISLTRTLVRRASSQSTRYGFIGLGRMGYPMCTNLMGNIGPSDTLLINDVNKGAVESFIAASGGRVKFAESPRALAEASDTIITMLPETRHVQSVFNDVLQQNIAGKLFIDCSTIDPVSSVAMGKSVQSAGGSEFVDAPVSGGVVGATAGTLTFMLGAEASQVDHIRPILSMMGSRTLHCGGPGAGLAGKLANNYLLAISNIASAEAMNLGIRLGLDPKVLASVINVSSGRCWSSEVNNCVPDVIEKAPASRDYVGGFGVGLMKKDLGLAMTAAEAVGAKLEIAKRAMEVYERLEGDEKFKGRDFSIVYKALQE